MSTYWNIECKRCGLEVFEDSYEWTKHSGKTFAELCASGMLSTKPSSTGAWTLSVINEYSRSIELDRLDTGCEHDFEPRDEYGHWASSEHWPDWHPKSQVTEGMSGAICTGIGDVRCIV